MIIASGRYTKLLQIHSKISVIATQQNAALVDAAEGMFDPPPFYTSTTFASCIYCLTLIFHYLSSKYGGLYKTSTGEIVYFIFKNFRIGRGLNKSMNGWPPPKIILHDICLLDHSKWWGTGMMPIQFFRTIAAKKSCFHFLRKYVH